MSLFILLTIAVSLSMDAFSLALAYGTLSLDKKHIYKLSSIVGFYHFLMPLLGMLTGKIIFSILLINSSIIVSLILTIIGIQMIIESFKKTEKQKIMSNIELYLFGLAVSIDSFSVGIGLKELGISPLFNALTFSFFSFIFTYLGLILGKKISKSIGNYSTIFGGIILILIGIIAFL